MRQNEKNICGPPQAELTNSPLLLSQGIEALEGYIDPSTSSAIDDKGTRASSDGGGETGETTKSRFESIEVKNDTMSSRKE